MSLSRPLATAVLLLLIGSGIWWGRGALLKWGLQLVLENTALTATNFSGFSLDREQVTLDEIDFDLETNAGPLAVKLERVSAGYDLKPPKLNDVSIGKARIKFAYKPTAKSASTDASSPGKAAFPLDSLTIEHLQLEVDSPWGLAGFDGQAKLDFGQDKALKAQLSDQQQTLTIDVAHDFHAANLIVERRSGGQIFEWHAELDPPDANIAFHAGAESLIDWFSTSSLVPKALRAYVPSSATGAILSGIAAVKLRLTANSKDHFDNLHGWLLLTQNDDYLASTDLSMATQSGILAMDAHLDMPAAQAFALLKPWLPAATSNWQLSSGRTQATARIRWDSGKALSGIAHLKTQELSLLANGIKLSNADFDIDVANIAERSANLTLTAGSVEVDKQLQLGNLDVKAHNQARLLTLDHARVSVFGGLLKVLPGPLNFQQSPLLLTLGVQDIELTQLLAAFNDPQLTGTGRISGKLPLTMSKDAIEVNGGMLTGTRPGMLSYQGPAADSDNLAFKALRNLMYHSLQARLDYRPTGDYQLGLRLEGNNPDVMTGHPLAFNLNINGKLPEILRKSILSGDFEHSILEQSKNRNKP